MDEKEAALSLYLEDWTLARIALVLGVAESTIKRWKKKYNWDERKQQLAILKKDSDNSIWELIHYQQEAIKQKTKQYKADAKAGAPLQLIDKGHIDALQKLYTIVKKKEADNILILDIINKLLIHIQEQDFKAAKQLEPFITTFIHKKINNE